LLPPERLSAVHRTAEFDCGQPELNVWLQRFALQNQAGNAATTWVVCPQDGHRVVGYYALASGSVERAVAPARVTAGLARHPIPVVILARLAVDREYAGQGLGSALFKDVLVRVNRAAGEIGIRVLLIHAKDQQARRFYEQFDVEPSPVDELQLFLLMKDLRRALRP
jgi:GNAT superfamily N-acetyltransferase